MKKIILIIFSLSLIVFLIITITYKPVFNKIETELVQNGNEIFLHANIDYADITSKYINIQPHSLTRWYGKEAALPYAGKPLSFDLKLSELNQLIYEPEFFIQGFYESKSSPMGNIVISNTVSLTNFQMDLINKAICNRFDRILMAKPLLTAESISNCIDIENAVIDDNSYPYVYVECVYMDTDTNKNYYPVPYFEAISLKSNDSYAIIADNFDSSSLKNGDKILVYGMYLGKIGMTGERAIRGDIIKKM